MSDHLGGCMLDGDIGTYAPQVWDALITDFQPKSVIDVGCGIGQSLAYFIQKGLTGIGIEGFKPAFERSPVKEHLRLHDYTTGPYIPDTMFDLAWSCEFVEHVDEAYTDNFLATFKKARVVAMTHAVPGQPGFHHVNCQTQEYWIDRMAKNGFTVDLEKSLKYRRLLWVSDTAWAENGGHVRNTLLVFKNEN